MNWLRWNLAALGLAIFLTATAAALDYDGYLMTVEFPPGLLSADTGLDADFPELEEVYAPAGLYKTDDLSVAEELRERGAKIRVEPNYIVTLDDAPLTPLDDAVLLDGAENPEEQWYDAPLGLDWTRQQGFLGAGVRVGVVDSGIFAEHQEFQGVNVLSGANYVPNGDPSDVSDSYGHGTFVSGIIAAAHDGVGLAGIAPAVELVPLKCFEGKTGSVAGIAKAIRDGVDTWRCQVLNLSLGLENDSPALRQAVEYAGNAGVVMVAAAGNLLRGEHNPNGDPLNYPAAYPQVIGVGAVDSTLDLSSFSYRNGSVEVVAPGRTLRGPSPSNAARYVTGYGTSYAAPMVTASVALTLSARPDLSRDAFRAMLAHTVRDFGPAGYDTSYGYGLLSVGNLLAAATGNLARQTDYFRQWLSEDTDGPTPALFLAMYDRDGAFLSAEDVSPPIAFDREPDTTPILAAAGSVSDEIFRVPDAASWRLIAFDRFTLSPLRSAVALYGP